jgi:hypothetical protein
MKGERRGTNFRHSWKNKQGRLKGRLVESLGLKERTDVLRHRGDVPHPRSTWIYSSNDPDLRVIGPFWRLRHTARVL